MNSGSSSKDRVEQEIAADRLVDQVFVVFGELIAGSQQSKDPVLWEFGLQELHLRVCPKATVPYRTFRSALYRSTINAQLAELGFTIALAEGEGKVDSSRYRLIRQG